MRPASLPAVLLAALALPTGCVSKKKYEALESTLTTTREALQDRKDEAESLMVDLDRATARGTALEGQLAACQAERASALAEKGELSASVQEMTAALLELSARQREADARIAEYRALLARFQSLVDAGKLKVKVIAGRLVVELATDVLFGSGKAALSPEGEAAVREVAAILATMPDRRFQVEGHTDDVPIRTAAFPSNWELASARALTVVQTLVDGGMKPAQVSAASYSQYAPLVANDSDAGRAANRRIQIVMVPDLSAVPGFKELGEAAGR
jgi:chemotaxis protein MotB